ncbi:MAG: hypothetical protein IPH13_05550 [Planctomycetes bacterium]|nr:hypothetical protein [Planctomycetota bacterium]MCC7172448.1 hypothetical protein [Planctomycetota bacterium]
MNRSSTSWILGIACTSFFSTAAIADVEITQSGSTLKIKCDASTNDLQLDGLGNCGMLAISNNGVSLEIVRRVREIRIIGGPANDSVRFTGIDISGSVKAVMKGGADTVRFFAWPAQKRGVFIGGNVDLSLGGQADDVALLVNNDGPGITIGRNLVIRGAQGVGIDGDGLTSSIEPGDVRVGGQLRILGSSQNPTFVNVSNVGVHGATILSTQVANDEISIEHSQFMGPFTLDTHGGNDTAVIGPSTFGNFFQSTAKFEGGGGNDTLELIENKFDAAFDPKVLAFEIVEN